MKFKSSRFNRFYFPGVIVVSALMPVLKAGTINPDTFGNITVPSATSSPDTIRASGGSFGTPTVIIEGGAVLTGDAVLLNGATVSSPGYTIENDGTLNVAGKGILVQPAGTGTTINNNFGGTIQGADDGINFGTNDGIVNNYSGANIRGITGVNSDGIVGLNVLTVYNAGSVSGAAAGVLANDDLDLINTLDGTISAGTRAGIDALNGALIDNYGTISSTGASGILVSNGADIINFTSFNLFSTPIAGGIIEGGTNGVDALAGLTLVNQNLSLISGLNGSGVDAGDDATITNHLGAEINGTQYGIIAGANAIITNGGIVDGALGGIEVGDAGLLGGITNTGTISGNGGDGVTLSGIGGNITNSGLIQGTTGIVANNGSTIINSGTIRSTAIGGNAFSGGAGNDTLFLNSGSVVRGNVLGGAGTNAITFNGGLTFPSGASNVIHGDVTGFTTITKTGAGVAFIGDVSDVGDGNSVTADTIAITSGGLYINADVAGSTVPKAIINAGGTALGGTGEWDADVNVTSGGFSAGAIPINLDSNPENAVGSVAIFGDVVHSAGSFIRVDIVPDAPIVAGFNNDVIDQIGLGNTYNVTGARFRISSTDGDRVLRDGTYTIIDSDEVIAGGLFVSSSDFGIQFNANTDATGPFYPTESGSNATNTVLTNFFLDPGLRDGGTNLVASIQHNYAGLPGLTSNQAALGGALDASVGSGNATVQNFIAALDFSNLEAVQATLASLTPDAFINYSAGIVNTNYRLHRQVQDHLAAVRSVGETVTTAVSPPQTDSKGGVPDSKGAVVAPQVTSSTKWNAWGSLSYDWQEYNGDQSDSDFDGETGAITAGIDYRVAPALVLGLALDGSKSDFDADSSSSDIESFRVLVYGTWGESKGLYSDFLAGYGNHSLDLDRDFSGILGGSSSSSTDANSFQALWTIGYTFGDSYIKHGPFAGLEYQKVDVDGYEQSGLLPVAVDDYDDESFRGLLGYRVNGSTGRWTPYVSVAYAHEFEDDGISAHASFGGESFTVDGADRGSAILVTTGTGIALTDALTLDLSYRGEFAIDDEGVTSNGATLGLNYRF